MMRRTLLALPFAMRLRADAAREVWDLLAAAASALSEGNAAAFMDCFDPKMPGYESLRADVAALVLEAEPRSSIEMVTNRGDGQTRALEADWLLDIVQRQGSMGSTRREERVKVRAAKAGKRWRIVAFEPAGFFAPPNPQ
jgi:murein L,D-transpeptidase YcbB/YkuD